MPDHTPDPPLVGVVMGSRSDWETLRHAAEVLDRAGHPARGAGGLGAPDARSALPLRPRGRGAGPGGPDRRRRRGGAPAGDAGGDLDPAGAGRAGREQGAARGRFAPVDRPDAPGRPGRHAGHRHRRRGQRGAAGRGDPGAEVSRDPRGPGRLPPGADRRGRGVADYEPDAVPTAPCSVPPASLGVIGGGQLGRMFIQAAQRMGYRAGVLSATDDAPAAQVAHWSVIGPARPPAGPAGLRRAGRGGHRRVRERLGPRAPLAGPPAAGPARLADRLGQPEPAPGEALPGPARGSRTPPGARSAREPSWTRPSRRSGCR